MLNRIWDALGEKGKIATLIGFCFSAPFNFWTLWQFFFGEGMTEQALTTVAIMNGLSMIWFILPSTIRIKGPKIEIEVID